MLDIEPELLKKLLAYRWNYGYNCYIQLINISGYDLYVADKSIRIEPFYALGNMQIFEYKQVLFFDLSEIENNKLFQLLLPLFNEGIIIGEMCSDEEYVYYDVDAKYVRCAKVADLRDGPVEIDSVEAYSPEEVLTRKYL